MAKIPPADFKLAQRILPPALLSALEIVFSRIGNGCMLVGGTALSGFYAGHRRSDDLDLFVKTDDHFRATRLAVESLTEHGAVLSNIFTSSQYYRALCEFNDHSFTIDIVVDKNLWDQSNVHVVEKNIHVLDLRGLFMTKAATLVSRCSEKDLYDLIWLFDFFSEWTIEDLIESGKLIDGGLNAESLLISLSGTTLREEACNFLLPNSNLLPKHVYKQISKLHKKLEKEILKYLEGQTAPQLLQLIQFVKKIMR